MSDDLKNIETYYYEGWDFIEKSYRGDTPEPHKSVVLSFIAELRREGYDKVFMAGTSLYDFMLSRSKRYGLRDGQSFIRFCFVFDPGAYNIIAVIDGQRTTMDVRPIHLTNEIKDLLEQLKLQAID